MKHYIEIENVGPIKKAKIDLSKYVVLIGPQGSGKSIIAKLIAIFRSEEFQLSKKIANLFEIYGISTFFTEKSKIKYLKGTFSLLLENFNPESHSQQEVLLLLENTNNINDIDKPSIYIPAERIIISLLSRSIFSILLNKINLPINLLHFASNYEKARNEIKNYDIKFLKANYSFTNGNEFLEINKQSTHMSNAASGFQTIIPMLLVCEYFLRSNQANTYIIEEPESNLFPNTQKDLLYHLITIINGTNYSTKLKNDLILTTHSPYILASLNNLLLAGKIKEEQPIKFTKAKKIVNGDFYISKNDLNVYAIKNGKAKSIISKETGLIAENELDHVSEEINYEFNALKNLYFEGAN